MKKLKEILKVIVVFIILQVNLLIPIWNVFVLIALMEEQTPTLAHWQNHKKPFWRANNNKIKLTISKGEAELLTLYEGTLKDLELSVSPEEYEIISKTDIKYIEVEDNIMVIRLWNERKINKLLGINKKH